MSKILPEKLLLSEHFYSIQGEGKTSGVPSYFLRMTTCDLNCGSSIQYLNKIKKGEINPNLNDVFIGDLEKEGKATWSCFLDNHRIQTPVGSKILKDVKVGDIVLGFNESSKKIEETKVVKVEFENINTDDLLSIKIGNRKVICTRDHLFYVKGTWKRADNLGIGDEIYHIPYHQLQSITSKNKWDSYTEDHKKQIIDKFGRSNKTYMLSDDYKKAHQEGQKKIDWEVFSQRMKTNNPMWNIESARKSWSNRHSHKISGPEKRILNLEKQYNWGIEYTGTGSFWIERQNPDFKVIGQNKVIEVYDSSSPRYVRGVEWENKRREIYARNGIEVLFIDFYNNIDKNSRYDLNRKTEIAGRIQEFIMNGEIVKSVEPYKGKKNTIAKIECFPHKNYFVSTLLSHNCDTTPVWLRGNYVEFEELINCWKTQGVYDKIRTGLIHLIWTGGEPTIKQHQESIINFDRFWQTYDNGGEKCNVFHEIETNGRNYINADLFNILDQINCSPKLSNSGMTAKQRIVPESIKRIMEHPNYQFKFVITNEDDIFEMFDTFINPFNIPLQNVCCMPGLVSRDNFHERTHFVLEMAKKYGFIGLTRLHVSAYDKLTGV